MLPLLLLCALLHGGSAHSNTNNLEKNVDHPEEARDGSAQYEQHRAAFDERVNASRQQEAAAASTSDASSEWSSRSPLEDTIMAHPKQSLFFVFAAAILGVGIGDAANSGTLFHSFVPFIQPVFLPFLLFVPA